MAREDQNLFDSGSIDANDPNSIVEAIVNLRLDFESHQHDGVSSRSFDTLKIETLSTRAISIRKTFYTDTTAGFWVGLVDNIPKFYLGNASSFVKWDGTTLSIAGSITATTGTIGGWTIGATSLTAGSGANTVGLDSGGSNPAFYAGSATPGSAPFRVTQAGALIATSGTIGGWTLGATTLVGGGVTLDSAGIITGGTIQTAASGQRVSISSSNNALNIYGASSLLGQITASGTGIGFFDGSSNLYAVLTSAGFGLSQGNMIIPAASVYGWSDTGAVFIDKSSSTVIRIAGADLSIASSGKRILLQGVVQPVIYFGYCSGTTVSRTNTGFTLTNPSTGNYTVTHNLGSSTYTVQATVLRASGAGAYIAKVAALGTNSFDVIVFDDAGAVQNSDFMFLLTQA